MLYMQRITGCSKILNNEEVKDFVIINFGLINVLNLQEKHCILNLQITNVRKVA